MPIYEYECPSCGHRFEKLVPISADAPPCPACEGTEVRKLVSASGFILKGGGWYKDHYGLKSSGGDSKKSDTKPSDSKGSSSKASSGTSSSKSGA